jgi:hypothetical protein
MPDYKLTELAAISLPDQSLADSLKNKDLMGPVNGFIDNADRAAFPGVFLARMLNLADRFLPVWSRARHNLVGDKFYSLSREELSALSPRIAEEFKKIVDEEHEQRRLRDLPKEFSPQWLENLDGRPPEVQRRREGVLFIIDAMVAYTGDFLEKGIESMLSGMVVEGWTAFETLAGDLWEAAVNAHPTGLSELKGGGSDNEAGSQTQERAALIAIKLVQKYGFNVADVMGTLRKEEGKAAFTTLKEIKETYARAFWEHSDSIKKALGDPSVEAISQARNVIVHKAGICDKKYEDRVKGGRLSPLPPIQAGQPLGLDGAIVKGLLDSAFACAGRLIQAVDGWLDGHPEKR